MSEVVPGTFREQENTESQKERPEESNAQRNSPGGRVLDSFCSEVDAVGDENTQGDEQLV